MSDEASFEQAVRELRIHGFTLIAGVLTQDEVAAIRQVNQRLLETCGDDLVFHGRAGHVTNLPARDPIYFDLIDHAKVLPLLEAAMGPDLILGSLNSRVVRPGEGRQRLHSDVPPRLRKSGDPVMMNTVWMLDDFTLENGATWVLPGSHLCDDAAPPAGFEAKHCIQAVAPAGSVLVFNGQCWHAGGENRTDQPRHALFGHYRVASWMRFQCNPHDGFDPAWLPRLSQRQRELLRLTRGLGRSVASDYDDWDGDEA